MTKLPVRLYKKEDLPAWTDLDGLEHCVVEEVAIIEKGTQGGRPSVGFRLRLPDGTSTLFETTGRLFVSVAEIICEVDRRNREELTKEDLN